MEVLYAWAVTSPCCNKPYSCSPSIGLCEDLPLYYPEFIWPQKKVGSITDGAPPVPRIQLPCPVTAYHVTAYDVTRISLRKICRPLYVTFEYLHDCQNTVILKRIQKWICFIAARGFTKPVTKPYCRNGEFCMFILKEIETSGKWLLSFLRHLIYYFFLMYMLQ